MESVNDRQEQYKALQLCFGSETALIEGDFTVRLLDGANKLRVALWHNNDPIHQPLIFFTTHTASGGRPAGLITKRDGSYFLLHDGRVRKAGYGRPSSDEEYVIDGVVYNFVGEIDKSLLRSIVSYHCSRPGANAELLGVEAFSPGPKHPIYVPEHTKNMTALHYELCCELLAFVERSGWVPLSRKRMCPDLAVVKGQSKILFEVKPSGDFQHICTAIGQLCLYDTDIAADRRIIVAPSNAIVSEIARPVLGDMGIEWVPIEPGYLRNSSRLKTILSQTSS